MRNIIALVLLSIIFTGCLDSNSTNITNTIVVKDVERTGNSNDKIHMCKFWAGNVKQTNNWEWMMFIAPCKCFRIDSEVVITSPDVVNKEAANKEIFDLLK